MSIEFNATKRSVQGTGASRRLRNTGRFPGVVYGGDKAPLSVEFDHNELYHLLRQEAFHSSVLTMNLEGAKETVILRDVQRHPFRQLVLHIDLQRVDATHKIHTKVPFHFKNADIAPGVKLHAGIVSHVMTEIDVASLPGNLPEFIEVDLKDLDVGHAIHASQLKLPNGVELRLHKGEDPVIASVAIPRGAVADEAAAADVAVAAAAAPAAGDKK
ncbi:MAG TPA: 50S ribosomal protein L25/general stress protein Ctc [Rhodocyclaceae bacterium]|jgi:large subunit ribosomal protein L25|nr:50S ribosomal protein L25/general stress protein Ctc [Rhodocyclaceae bacterium]